MTGAAGIRPGPAGSWTTGRGSPAGGGGSPRDGGIGSGSSVGTLSGPGSPTGGAASVVIAPLSPSGRGEPAFTDPHAPFPSPPNLNRTRSPDAHPPTPRA